MKTREEIAKKIDYYLSLANDAQYTRTYAGFDGVTDKLFEDKITDFVLSEIAAAEKRARKEAYEDVYHGFSHMSGSDADYLLGRIAANTDVSPVDSSEQAQE